MTNNGRREGEGRKSVRKGGVSVFVCVCVCVCVCVRERERERDV